MKVGEGQVAQPDGAARHRYVNVRESLLFVRLPVYFFTELRCGLVHFETSDIHK